MNPSTPTVMVPSCEMINGKIVHAARNMELVYARDLWPKRLDIPEGAQVLMGESFVHDEWHPIRTSLIANIDREAGLVETRNSYYRLTDGKLTEVEKAQKV